MFTATRRAAAVAARCVASDVASTAFRPLATPLGCGAVLAVPAQNRGLSTAPADVGDAAEDAAPASQVPKPSSAASNLTPAQIVKALDEHIVGQADAKRAIAVALRNRWRRQRVPAEMQEDIIPKNILMVGPTGVGKTEIARRLARFANAPFVKVEATKFTEVGYHGRDVDSIVKDLVAAAAKVHRQLKEEELRPEIDAAVEDTLLKALTGTNPEEVTWKQFQDLLREGQLEDLEVEVEVPRRASDDSLEFNVVGGGSSVTVDPTEILMHMQKHASGGRNQRKKLQVKHARPQLFEAELDRRLKAVNWRKEAVELAEQHGIVFIDEVDKIVSSSARVYKGGDASAEGVQRDLLPLIEGTTVDVKKFGPVRTDYVLFVASGAFSDSKPSDMMAELQGRLPIRVELAGLSAEDMHRILTVPKHNLLAQQQALMAAEGIQLTFTDDAVWELARQSAEINKMVENIGARRLHTVLERVMDDISFDAADAEEGTEVVVDAERVKSKLEGLSKRTDLKKFIL